MVNKAGSTSRRSHTSSDSSAPSLSGHTRVGAQAPGAEKILEYITKHNLTNVLNQCVNKLVREAPDDPWTNLARQLAKVVPPTITKLHGREVLDSRGNPTVEVDVYVKSELIARGCAPSGASTGSNEARELRDDDAERFLGKGTLTAVKNVNGALSDALKAKDPRDLATCDECLCKADGTQLKEKLGGNAVTAASFAIAEAGARLRRTELFEHFSDVFAGRALDESSAEAKSDKYSLPTPMVNILNGGKHAGGDLKIQEFMIMPKAGISFREGLRQVTTVYHHLGKILVAEYGKSAKNLGDEGGFAPQLKDAEEALKNIEKAVEAAGLEVNKDIFLALDCAASEFYDEEKKQYEISPGKFLASAELVDFYAKLVEDHPALISIEDGMHEQDYEGWIAFTSRLGDKLMSVGDDLYTTNTELIKKGIEENWANALLLKVNQIGTISEAMDAARLIFEQNQNVIVSHRSGETPSSLIADLAVGIGASHIKTGAPARGERIAKYNRLLQIEDYLRETGMLEEPTVAAPADQGEGDAVDEPAEDNVAESANPEASG